MLWYRVKERGVWLAHAVHLNEAEIRALAETGTPVSVSVFSELRTGMGIAPVVQMMRAGVHVTISLDTMAASDNSDIFAALRTTMCIERGRYEDATVYNRIRCSARRPLMALGLSALPPSPARSRRARRQT